ncbi:capsid scaffolding serine peptidase GPO [Crenobacter luteus]|uniref:GPO family capsid scaffolding protein n=1 Tax=Crenobacter luteus TaxID=1452487 RepID=UPI0010EF1191|nr:GPO family capsid scaffolding protein [Crenobacter luteus]TCP13758.1 capsid scaffolding serine peptidase GPO [Crenobacter luteus]
MGTEMLQFSAKAENNPLAKRKLHPENLFSAAIEFTLEMEDEQPGKALLEGFSAKIKGIVAGFKKSSDANFTEIQQAIEVIAESQREVLEKFAALPQGPDLKPLQEQVNQLSADHAKLVKTLSQQPDGPARDRTPGGATTITTDC